MEHIDTNLHLLSARLETRRRLIDGVLTGPPVVVASTEFALSGCRERGPHRSVRIIGGAANLVEPRSRQHFGAEGQQFSGEASAAVCPCHPELCQDRPAVDQGRNDDPANDPSENLHGERLYYGQAFRKGFALTTLEQVLDTYGHDLTAADFTTELERTLSGAGRSAPGSLSAHDRDVLLSSGVLEADLDTDATNGLIHTQANNLMQLAADSATVAQIADRLHRSEQRIRGAIADGSLYAVKIGKNWRLPTWQFHDDKVLPRLRAMVAEIPAGTSALSIGNLMTTPTRELFLDDRPVSPRAWLLAGGDPVPVVTMIGDLVRW